MPFKIVTWNVNSLRVRLPQLLAWLEKYHPEIVAIQETKVEDKDFPAEALRAAGYHCVFAGQKTYNGVAILSLAPLEEMTLHYPIAEDPQVRLIAATTHALRVINVYVPNGESVGSEKYQYKLAWLKGLSYLLAEELKKRSRLVVLGDFNIAPTDADVHDPAVWEGQVMVSSAERQFLKEILSLGLNDVFRLFEQSTEGYTWWDYRSGAFRRNHGLRIDLTLVSNFLAPFCRNSVVDVLARKVERPSDHAPVLTTLDFPEGF